MKNATDLISEYSFVQNSRHAYIPEIIWPKYSAYCPVNNRLHLLRKKGRIYIYKFLLPTFYIIVPNIAQRWDRLYRSSKARSKSSNGTTVSSFITPRWASLLSLKCCALRASFTFGKRIKSACAKYAKYGGSWITQIDLEARNCFTFNVQWAGALSCNSSHLCFGTASFMTRSMRAYKPSITSKL